MDFSSYTTTCVEISYQHLTKNDLELLKKGTKNFVFPILKSDDNLEYMIWIFNDNDLDEIIEEMNKAGFSKEFQFIVKEVSNSGAYWLNISDAIPHPEL